MFKLESRCNECLARRRAAAKRKKLKQLGKSKSTDTDDDMDADEDDEGQSPFSGFECFEKKYPNLVHATLKLMSW